MTQDVIYRVQQDLLKKLSYIHDEWNFIVNRARIFMEAFEEDVEKLKDNKKRLSFPLKSKTLTKNLETFHTFVKYTTYSFDVIIQENGSSGFNTAYLPPLHLMMSRSVSKIVPPYSLVQNIADLDQSLKRALEPFESKSKISRLEIPPFPLYLGSVIEMAYSHGDNPLSFWLRPQANVQAQYLPSMIQNKFKNKLLVPIVQNPPIGEYVLGTDGVNFFRGMVLSIRPKTVELLDVDSGKKKIIRKENLWQLDDEIASVHAQAVHCRMKGLQEYRELFIDELLDKSEAATMVRHLFRDSLLSVLVHQKIDGNPPICLVEVFSNCIYTGKVIELAHIVLSEIVPLLKDAYITERIWDTPESANGHSHNHNEMSQLRRTEEPGYKPKPVLNVETQNIKILGRANSSKAHDDTKVQTSTLESASLPNLKRNVPANTMRKWDQVSLTCHYDITNKQESTSDFNLISSRHATGDSHVKDNTGAAHRTNSKRYADAKKQRFPSPVKVLFKDKNSNNAVTSKNNDRTPHITLLERNKTDDVSNRKCIFNIKESENNQGGKNLEVSKFMSRLSPDTASFNPPQNIAQDRRDKDIWSSDWGNLVRKDEKISSDTCYYRIDQPHRDTTVSSQQSTTSLAVSCGDNWDALTKCDYLEKQENDGWKTKLAASINGIPLDYCRADIQLEKVDYSNYTGNELLAVPSHVISPTEFYMQLVKDEHIVNSLQKDMNEFYLWNKIEFNTKIDAKTIISKYCVAQSCDSSVWRRAQVIDWFDETTDSITISFVDYGNRSTISYKMIQPLLIYFSAFPVLSHKCCFASALSNNSTVSKIAFECPTYSKNLIKELLKDGQVYVIRIAEGSEQNNLSVFVKDLNKPEEYINDLLVDLVYDKGMKQSIGDKPSDKEGVEDKNDSAEDCSTIYLDAFHQLRLPNVGERVHLKVTTVLEGNRFYSIIKDMSSRKHPLDGLTDAINKNTSSSRMQQSPQIGQIVLAQYSFDQRWYRAKIAAAEPVLRMQQVFYVDYGNTEWVKETAVRNISPEFLQVPFQAVDCSLANIHVDSDSAAFTTFFKRVAFEKLLEAKVVYKNERLNYLEVLLFTSDGQDIGQLAVAQGCATPFRKT